MSTEPIFFLRSARLYLRPLEPSDALHFQGWINNPETRKFICRQFPTDLESETGWIKNLSIGGELPKNIVLAIILNAENLLIGNIALHDIDWLNRRAETGMLIGPKEMRSQGYGYEAKELLLKYAFDTLGLHRVVSMVLASNPRSAACLKKNGYIEEGRQRNMYFRDGAWFDELIFGLLATDWRTRQSKA